jgi:UDP-N-acetylglucosamine 2-epimerase
MKVLTIVGARPQFIKAAVVSHQLRKKHIEIMVHTGQHFDYNMSQSFFDELDIPAPDYNLGISGGTHAQMTGKMMIAIEEVLMKEKPDWLLLYGDTNSTVAGALSAAKLHIPIAHVEAGARTHSMTNPEEINRVCTDHVSTLLLTSTEEAVDNLKHEGLGDRATFVGNTMYDAFVEYSQKVNPSEIRLTLLSGEEASVPTQYYYMTCHREENTNDDQNLKEILDAMNSLDAVTIYPVHPRNKTRALRLQEQYGYKNIMLTEPVGYIESTSLLRHCKKVVTDSGGLQTEAFFAGKKCVTILNFVVWPETMVSNRNELAKPNAEDILEKLNHEQTIDPAYQPFGDGHAADKVVIALEEYVGCECNNNAL